MAMLLASLSVSLRLYASSSLKEKRFVVQSVKRRLRNRFNVAVCETDGHDSWKSAELALVTVGRDRAAVDRELEAVTRFLDRDARFEVVDRVAEYF